MSEKMPRMNFLPLSLVGTNIDPNFYIPSLDTLNAIADVVDDDDDEDQDELAYIVLTNFLEPFVTGDYDRIDINNQYDQLITELSQYQDDNRMLVAINAMSAAIASRLLHNRLITVQSEKDECNTLKNDLHAQLAQLEHELKVARGQIEEMKQFETKIEAKVSIQSVEILPMIAQVNIVMGWYYYMNGYDPLRPIDPLKYMDAKIEVVRYGDQVDNVTGRYGAYDELMRRLIADKAEREAAKTQAQH